MLKKEKIIKASNKLKSKKMAKLATQNKIIKIIIAIIFILQILQPINVQANTVEYNGEKGLIATPNDFFLNINELLPGDTKEDVAYIKNTTNNEIEVFFKTEPIDKTEYYDDIDYSLLEKIKLKITLKSSNNSEEKTIYDGNLGAELMNNYISLGKYTKKYNGELKVLHKIQEEEYDAEDFIDEIIHLVDKKYANKLDFSDYKSVQRVTAALARRGFAYDDIKLALSRVKDGDYDEEEYYDK